jgi:hypothetical protein
MSAWNSKGMIFIANFKYISTEPKLQPVYDILLVGSYRRSKLKIIASSTPFTSCSTFNRHSATSALSAPSYRNYVDGQATKLPSSIEGI